MGIVPVLDGVPGGFNLLGGTVLRQEVNDSQSVLELPVLANEGVALSFELLKAALDQEVVRILHYHLLVDVLPGVDRPAVIVSVDGLLSLVGRIQVVEQLVVVGVPVLKVKVVLDVVGEHLVGLLREEAPALLLLHVIRIREVALVHLLSPKVLPNARRLVLSPVRESVRTGHVAISQAWNVGSVLDWNRSDLHLVKADLLELQLVGAVLGLHVDHGWHPLELASTLILVLG